MDAWDTRDTSGAEGVAARPLPGPRGPAHAAPREGTSRRWFLVGGGVLLLAAGGGVATEFLLHDSAAPRQAPRAPRALLAAVDAERALIADLDATTGGSRAVRQVIRQARADHEAHLRALRPLLAKYRRPRASGSAKADTPRGRPRTAAQLRDAERRASSTAALHAEASEGSFAALLASIAACEATHAELLS